EDSGVRRPLVREQALLVEDRNVDAGQVLADPKRVHLRHVLEQLRPEPAVVAHRRGLGRRAEADYLLRSADARVHVVAQLVALALDATCELGVRLGLVQPLRLLEPAQLADTWGDLAIAAMAGVDQDRAAVDLGA